MDVRLIDANAVLKEIKETYCTYCNSYNGIWCRACEHMDDMDFIEDAPTIDAQPVKHGKWIKIDSESFHCSECDAGLSGICVSEKYISREKFCYNCGAKMDGDADETP